MKLARYIWTAFTRPLNLLLFGGALITGWWMNLGEFYWPAILGIEALYLAALVSNGRFRTYVDGRSAAAEARRAEENALMNLRGDGQRSYRELKRNCEAMLAHIARVAPAMVDMHREELAKLAGVYLQLVSARQSLRRTLEAAGTETSLDQQLQEVSAKLADPGVTADLRISLESQRDVISQRKAAIADAHAKAAFVDAEIARIEHQVKLLRDQVSVATAPEQVGERISQIAATLQGTTKWVGQQKSLLGEEPAPPVTLEAPAVRQ